MTPEDIANAEAEYTAAHGQTPKMLRGSLSDLDQQQTSLEGAINGLEALETHYDGIVKTYQHKRDEVADERKVLERDHDACKRRYWVVKNGGDRSGQKPSSDAQP